MLTRKLVAIALGGLLSSVAYADSFYINTGTDLGSNGSTNTTAIAELGYTGTLATSIYLGDPSVAGTTVIDSNIQSVLNSYGFTTGSHTTIGGNSVTFSYPIDPAQMNIDNLNPAQGVISPDNNGFVSGVGGCPTNYGCATTGGNTWGLTYLYDIQGVTTATGVSYTSGTFDVFYNDGGAPVEVLRLDVTGSSLQLANLNIFGNIDYSFCSPTCTTFQQNFFNMYASNQSFYSSWLAGQPSSIGISWILDTNVNPPLPSINDLVAVTYNGGQSTALIRQTTLDGSVTFKTPEPMSIALLGVGLMAAGIARKRTTRAA